MVSWFFILLAILGLSFLIFIHELGHYIVAKRVGMRVETFAIGFGKPIYSWMRDGTKWQIGWLLFGGYVKIAGSELDEDKDPYSIPDGFFGRPPIDRIKVAIMGPVVNIVFAFLMFAALWFLGGREKNFSQYTSKIGWVDPKSELYAKGIRPGDEIISYGDITYKSEMDHIYGPMKNADGVEIKGFHVSYADGAKQPFTVSVKPYTSPSPMKASLLTAGILQPASYIFYNPTADTDMEGSPLKDSGIQPGDRIAWIGGDYLYSQEELQYILNDKKVLVTVQRGNETLLRRVPKVLTKELRPDTAFFAELRDWQYEAKLQNSKLNDLYTIPYNLTNNAVVEERVKLLEKSAEEEFFPKVLFNEIDEPLKTNDRIISINGQPIQHSYDLLSKLQLNLVNVIVERAPEYKSKISTTQADDEFNREINWADLQKIVNSIGTNDQLAQSGQYYLLKPVTPLKRSDFPQSEEKKAQYTADLEQQQKAIAGIEDPEKRAKIQQLINDQNNRLLLGFAVSDRKVTYNPGPVELFTNVFEEISGTLSALFTRSLSPKMMAGPVGIIGVVQQTMMTGVSESIYWLGFISLNLGMLNLLPIPVLDGGTIMLSLYEMITKKRIKPKTLEKLTLPFAILLIGLFVFLTYNDLTRIFGGL